MDRWVSKVVLTEQADGWSFMHAVRKGEPHTFVGEPLDVEEACLLHPAEMRELADYIRAATTREEDPK